MLANENWIYEFPSSKLKGQLSTLHLLGKLKPDVENSADFATILSNRAVSAGAAGLAYRPGTLSANAKNMNAVRHEFGHNFGGHHFNDPIGYAAGYKKARTILGGNSINYYSNPRINHPKFGVPLGRHNTNDVARYITEKRFSLNRGDESRACYTCNAYSGQSRGYNCSAADEINPKPQACCGSLTQPEPEFWWLIHLFRATLNCPVRKAFYGVNKPKMIKS